jgi:hypothetical protein
MAEILQIKYYDLETGKDIPMSQEDEGKEKKKWKKRLAWLFGWFIVGVGYGFGTGGGPFVVKKITITAVDRPDPNK